MFFDWNEVRVTTIPELSEALRMVPAPSDAATRLKQVLQSVFETHYSFDLEFLKKENIGKAVKTLEKYHGITPFTVAYVTQIALGGHSIPVDKGVLSTFVALGVATEIEAEKQHVPGVDRAIPKTKGVEFASLLHQLGADYHASPFSQRVRSMILEIAPDAKDRFPKRSTKQKKAPKKTAKAARTKGKSTATRAGGATKKKVSKSKAAGQKPGKKTTTKRLSRKKPRQPNLMAKRQKLPAPMMRSRTGLNAHKTRR